MVISNDFFSVQTTPAHETAHFLGLPDLYDTNGDGSGIGSWSLMANSWGFDGTQYYPPQLDPWSKIELGWANVTTLSKSQDNILLNPSYTHHEYFKIDHGLSSVDGEEEYFIIENRQALGFDKIIGQVSSTQQLGIRFSFHF
jgi:M6 family metalloprotease-like protein